MSFDELIAGLAGCYLISTLSYALYKANQKGKTFTMLLVIFPVSFMLTAVIWDYMVTYFGSNNWFFFFVSVVGLGIIPIKAIHLLDKTYLKCTSCGKNYWFAPSYHPHCKACQEKIEEKLLKIVPKCIVCGVPVEGEDLCERCQALRDTKLSEHRSAVPNKNPEMPGEDPSSGTLMPQVIAGIISTVVGALILKYFFGISG